MKKRKKLPVLLLTLVLIFALIPSAVSAEGGTEIDRTGVNLIKVTTDADFAAGVSDNLVPASEGNGALKLADGATDGTFVSAIYSVKDFAKMVGSWNASLGEGVFIEVSARSFADGVWSDWFSWGKYGMTIRRGSASEDVDEFVQNGTISKVQFKASLHRDDILQSAVMRQLSFSVKGGDAEAKYAEDEVLLPVSVKNDAPAYSQSIRDPSIGGSICSPSTMTVALNSRDPSLDLLPEELALSVQDFNYGFGNWAFCVSAAGLYGYESYAQYADKDILMQELAHGRTVGLSVSYSPDPNSSYPYLEGAYGGTGGHLISIIGYEYKDAVMDDEHLYFYSSDTYSPSDATSFHYYKWTQLDECWSGRLAYIVMSEPEAGAGITGIRRFEADLTEAGSGSTYELGAGGTKVDLTSFTNGKMSTLGHGVLAYTIEGMATTASEESAASIVYDNRIQVTANNKFFYNNISTDNSGNLVFNGGEALYRAGVPEGTEKAVTIYAFASNGKTYYAEKTFTSIKPEEEPADDYEEVETKGNLTFADLTAGTAKGAAVMNEGRVTLNGKEGAYYTPIYKSVWEPEYLMATINASTPGNSSVELQIRAVAERAEGKWSDWFTWGQFGSGTQSASNGRKDEYLNMSTDIFVARGDSENANIQKYQFRILLKAGTDGSVPIVSGLNFTIKKAAYSASEAIYTGKTAEADIPDNAGVDIEPTSAYSYADGMESWRLENMMLMLLNGQGADPLFEEVALNGYDFGEGWGNWAFTPFKAGLFGYGAYTQFAANTTMIKQAIADGHAVGLFINGASVNTTNSGGSRQIVVYAYEKEAGATIFRYYCCSGDADELADGDVANTCTEEELQHAIEACTSSSARGIMYVVTGKTDNGSVVRVPAEAEYADEQKKDEIILKLDGRKLEIPEGFENDFESASGNGKTAYLLGSERKDGKKLSQAVWHHGISVGAGGTLKLPEEAVQAVSDGDTIELYVVANNGITYTARLGNTPSPEYAFIDGIGAQWTKKSGKDLRFRAAGEYEKFTVIMIDGEDVDASNYTSSSGSTIITIRAPYLETLSVGEHELTAVYIDGRCAVTFSIREATPGGEHGVNPQTPGGQNTPAPGGSKIPAPEGPNLRAPEGARSAVGGKAADTGDRNDAAVYLLIIAVCAATAVTLSKRRSGR